MQDKFNLKYNDLIENLHKNHTIFKEEMTVDGYLIVTCNIGYYRIHYFFKADTFEYIGYDEDNQK